MGEMAARVPVDLEQPLRIVVEPDHVAQALHTGTVGEAVPGKDADLHLVWHPDDLHAYRYAVARVLIARAGLELAPWVERGAALWLSRDWYGKPYRDWLPLLAAARALPEPEQLLLPLGEEEQGDASTLLWTPAAAAWVERLPGQTVREKVRQPHSREKVAETLAELATLAPPAKPSPARPRPPFLEGVSLAMQNSVEAGYHAPVLDRQLDVLARIGAGAVSLMPFAFQRDVNRPELFFQHRHPRGETDIGMIYATRRARARGFHVLYKPHIWVRSSWVGEIEMKSERDWALWWQGYRRYILHHAMLARWAGADLFCVGVELSKATGREREWRDLIAAVRLFFPGPVTYAANWYGDLERVAFWDALDLIGVDAYFPLSSSPEAKRADLAAGARAVAARLEAASRRYDRPVLLAEVGFAARRAAWAEPHTEGVDYSEEDQALAYEVLFKALGRRPWLAGTFVWKAFSGVDCDGDHRADFCFLGRKAETAVRAYYSQ